MTVSQGTSITNRQTDRRTDNNRANCSTII